MIKIKSKLVNSAYIEAFNAFKAHPSSLSSVQESLLIAASFIAKPRMIFIVKPNLYQAQQLSAKLEYWLKDQVILCPAEDALRVEAIASSPEIATMRMEAIEQLLSKRDLVCVTHVGAAIRYYPLKSFYLNHQLELELGKQLDRKDFIHRLRHLGYEETSRADTPATFASRGEVVDIYPINQELAVRIEFFDDEIEQIRLFDPQSQRTQHTLDKFTVQSASDLIFTEAEADEIEAVLLEQRPDHALNDMDSLDLEGMRKHLKENHYYRYRSLLKNKASLFDYRDKAEVILSSTEDVFENQRRIVEENTDYLRELSANGRWVYKFQVFGDLGTNAAGHQRRDIRRFSTRSDGFKLPFREIDSPSQSLTQHVLELKKKQTQKQIYLCLNEHEIKQIIPLFIEHQVPYQMQDKPDENRSIILLKDDLDEGFSLLDENIEVYTAREIFNTQLRLGRYQNKFKEAERLNSAMDLKPGDYVVHYHYGVGQYMGTITRETNRVHKDYLHVVYRNDSSLYIPLEQFQLVRKFVSKEGVVPRLHKLGSNEWKKTKEKLKENVLDLAERLIELYSMREDGIGHAFGEDNELQTEFEAEFPYPLTQDQEKAIHEVKADMMKMVPMDRLLCGDVGFGKTEVALRAAFKAVSERKQVAFLCPTTILSQQHYRTFTDRLKNYAVNVAVLNRFVPPQKQKEIIRDLEAGKIDILIGTHRILSKDIRFKDLALLVIDEEQRFGVEHKEKIKEVKQSVHVLSLSATPIPRTLQMSLVGVRALSQLETPPLNRLPVLTYVIEKNRALIRDVIERELSRNGQVFYLYNHVEQIHAVAGQLERDCPNAKVAVVHGQMNREEIEDIMMQFTRNEINVLVCTTIVETGIDIPNANTILIDRADTFGLSQLYQIKGRVGRSDRLAYAYLMYHPRKQLSEIAQKRLQSIKEFTELGSGYKIALRDLTIRGAGEMLGDSQSGFIDTVGIDMYIEMLTQAIEAKKNNTEIEETELVPRVSVDVDAYIPSDFESRDYEKLSLYQRIEACKDQEELELLRQETEDLYGKLPKSVQLLFEKKVWEQLLESPILDKFKEINTEVMIYFSRSFSQKINGITFFEKVSKLSKDIQMKYTQGQVIVRIPKQNDWLFMAIQVVKDAQMSERS